MKANILKWLGVVLLIIIVVAVFNFFKGHTGNEDIKAVEQKVDAFLKADEARGAKLDSLQTVNEQISTRITAIDAKVATNNNKLLQQKTDNEKARNILSGLPDDEQFRIFKEWISEADTL